MTIRDLKKLMKGLDEDSVIYYQRMDGIEEELEESFFEVMSGKRLVVTPS